jgi:hypothetical protein
MRSPSPKVFAAANFLCAAGLVQARDLLESQFETILRKCRGSGSAKRHLRTSDEVNVLMWPIAGLDPFAVL